MPEQLPDPRRVLEISGADARKFLQDLITNDLGRAKDGLCYAALLSAQGKFVVDFFIEERDNLFLLDCPAPESAGLLKRLSLYKLRADVLIQETDLVVSRGLEQMPQAARLDPRHEAMGWRLISSEDVSEANINWDALRVAHLIPLFGAEILPNESYILELGFARLNGVDFKKGCYVGQEVTARMHHKTELRKGLYQVKIDGHAPIGTEVLVDGKTVGYLGTQSDGLALAYLRFDRIAPDMQAGDALINRCEPA